MLPVHALVQAAAVRHEAENVAFDLSAAAGPSEDPAAEPVVARSPEIIHGLGTIIQNAAQFARDRVEINTQWDREFIRVHIRDDGPGFAAGLLERLGEPYISSRKRSTGHMGLGIFIARTLLQRSGAIAFRNDPEGGAAVDIVWRRDTLENPDVESEDKMDALEHFEDRTLLIVDDDEPFLGRLARAMETRLRCRDCRVGARRGCCSKIDAARVRRSRLASCRWQRSRHRFGRPRRPPESRIVMLTGYGNIATAVAAVKAGALDYLAKPADADAVEAALLSNGDGLPRRRKIRCLPTGFAGNIFNGFTSNATVTFPKLPVG